MDPNHSGSFCDITVRLLKRKVKQVFFNGFKEVVFGGVRSNPGKKHTASIGGRCANAAKPDFLDIGSSDCG